MGVYGVGKTLFTSSVLTLCMRLRSFSDLASLLTRRIARVRWPVAHADI